MIQKPAKAAELAASYRSLLPVLLKLFQKLLLPRLCTIIEKHKSIPSHQFGLRQHAIIEQIHRIVKRIHNDIEANRYCMAVFFEVSQVFNKF